MKQYYKNKKGTFMINKGTYMATDKKPVYDYLFKKEFYIGRIFQHIYTTNLDIEDFEDKWEEVDETTNVYLNLLDKYENEQMVVAVEELSELQKEICKAMRNKDNEEHLTEEIADVEIMLEQVKLYYNIDQNAVESQKQAKIKRTVERCLHDD